MSSRYVDVGTEINGIPYKGRYRVVRGMIAVKYLNNIKVVPLGEIEAKILAKMLLNELVGQSIFGQIFHLKSKKKQPSGSWVTIVNVFKSLTFSVTHVAWIC